MSGEVSVPKEAFDAAVNVSGTMRKLEAAAPLILAANRGREIADELERLAGEMDNSPSSCPVTAEDVRARAAQLRGEDTWCNCQAVPGTSNYPGPWHPKGDPVGCLKWGRAVVLRGEQTDG